MPEINNFDNAEETRTFNNGRIDLVTVAGRTFGRATFQPGWSWANDVKPIAGTESCQVHHVDYVVSGELHVVLDDGTELDARAGDVMDVPPGHNAWVTSAVPCVTVSLIGEGSEVDYAKPA